jgi:hypothetical protein
MAVGAWYRQISSSTRYLPAPAAWYCRRRTVALWQPDAAPQHQVRSTDAEVGGEHDRAG